MWGEYYMPESRPVPMPTPLPRETNPDLKRSESGMWIEEHGGDLYWVLKVHGLGALLLRAETSHKNKDGKLTFFGVSSFTSEEIRRGEL